MRDAANTKAVDLNVQALIHPASPTVEIRAHDGAAD
jgi:hypothetical protein